MRILIYFFFLVIGLATTEVTNESSELLIWRGGNLLDEYYKYPDIEYHKDQFENIANKSNLKTHVIYSLRYKDEIDKVLNAIPDTKYIERNVLIEEQFIKQKIPLKFINLQQETTNLFFVIDSHGDPRENGNLIRPEISGKNFADFIREIFENNKNLVKMILIVTSCYSHLFVENLLQVLDESLKNNIIILPTTSPNKPIFNAFSNYGFNLESPPHQFYTLLQKELFLTYEWSNQIKNATPTYNFMNTNNWKFSDLLKNNHGVFIDQEFFYDHNAYRNPDKLSMHGKDFHIKSEEFDFTPTKLRIRYYFQKCLSVTDSGLGSNIIVKIESNFPKFTEILKILDHSKLQMQGIDGVDKNSQKAIFHTLGQQVQLKTKKVSNSFYSIFKVDKFANGSLKSRSLFKKESENIVEFFRKHYLLKTFLDANWYLDIIYDLKHVPYNEPSAQNLNIFNKNAQNNADITKNKNIFIKLFLKHGEKLILTLLCLTIYETKDVIGLAIGLIYIVFLVCFF